MGQEWKTANIVREHFNQFLSELQIEEKSSSNPRIDKLLKSASKHGDGKGFPDFLISFKTNHDLLIAVECKSSVHKHRSSTLTEYRDYAVDGALLYASHLSKQFDVWAVGVSGVDRIEMKVSHFLYLKDETSPQEIPQNDYLLSVEDYLNQYITNPVKYQQDYESLLVTVRELNENLHANKIVGSNRSILISMILIALEREPFRNAYAAENNPQQLAKMVEDTAVSQLNEANIPTKRLEVLKQQFGFLKTETVLTTKDGELINLIQKIDDEINSFAKTHKYRDVLGNLYVEFLRYANNDKGLGIVLTPPHITEFFTDLVNVGKNDIVYDNCVGTGGFLISSMKKMINDAGADTTKESAIKSRQLYGVEVGASIYPLAVSNMYIHQDGKSNIILGNCFDSEIQGEIKNKRPTIGFLNPPYKADKKKDTDELEYVLNNLECLIPGGQCTAIVPMQSALAKKGNVAEKKRRLMAKHTLECVLSMPNELFFNSDVGVVSCIVVFTAHRPHPGNKEVFLGYYKDDGFVKRKGLGRVDAKNKWGKVKVDWLDKFVNRIEEPGLSVNVKLNDTDEWVAEAYMETDYSQISDDLFERSLLDYSTYQFSNKICTSVSDLCAHTHHTHHRAPSLTLNHISWNWFEITDLFTVKGSKTTSILELEAFGSGKFPYVTTQATNNGVAGFFSHYTEEGGVLTADSAVVGYCSYQKTRFSASDHVEKLMPKFHMNDFVALFLLTVINMEQYRYNYGRKCSQTRLRESRIKLPATAENSPDYEFMEQYIKTLPYSSNLR